MLYGTRETEEAIGNEDGAFGSVLTAAEAIAAATAATRDRK